MKELVQNDLWNKVKLKIWRIFAGGYSLNWLRQYMVRQVTFIAMVTHNVWKYVNTIDTLHAFNNRYVQGLNPLGSRSMGSLFTGKPPYPSYWSCPSVHKSTFKVSFQAKTVFKILPPSLLSHCAVQKLSSIWRCWGRLRNLVNGHIK